MKNLIPVKNCKVRTLDGSIGLVKEIHPKKDPKDLLILRQNGGTQWVKVSDVQSGFSEKNYVIHKPPSGIGQSLGLGKILMSRNQFGFTHLLVSFAEVGGWIGGPLVKLIQLKHVFQSNW